MLNHITCQPHLLVLFGVTLVPPEMLLEFTDIESIENDILGLCDLITYKVLMTVLMVKHEYMWQRSNCDYTTSVKRHIESKQVGSVVHECDFCQHRVHTKNALSFHKASNHADAATNPSMGTIHKNYFKHCCKCVKIAENLKKRQCFFLHLLILISFKMKRLITALKTIIKQN
jgi:hypothetical protein